MECPSDDTFGQWLDGALDEASSARIDAHAAECEPCRDLARHLRTRRAPAVPAKDAPRALLGRYEAGATLGRGTRGTVVAATDAKTGRRVAVKSLRAPDDPTTVAKFAREVRLLARVKSAHVVEFVEAGFDADGAPILVMARVDGDSLEERLVRGGPLSSKVVVDYLEQICDGLGAIHAAGIVHRDLKLSNVLVDRRSGRDVLTIVDFGLAREVGAPPSSSGPSFAGTPYYVAPEQIDDPASVDARADVWALGVCAHRLLTGQYPFEGKTAWETFAKVSRGERQALADARPGLPPALVRIVERCLERDPQRRFADVGAVSLALALADEATLPPPSERTAPSFVARATIISVVFIALGFLGAWLATWIHGGP